MSTPRRGKTDRRLTLRERMASLARRLDRKVLAYVAVFVVVFVCALWFSFNEPSPPFTTIVAGEAGEAAPDMVAPAVTAPQRRSPKKASPATDAGETAGRVVERQAPVDRRQRVAGTVGRTDIQSGDVHEPRQEHSAPLRAAPEGDLEISGRVLTRSGTPLAGIQVTATATHLFEQGRRIAIPPGAGKRQTTSAYDGAYAFQNLANGEYHVSTVATELYSRAFLQVRAGVEFADLVVARHQDFRVQGIVTTGTGIPIDGAGVRASTADAREVRTDRDGRYAFDLRLPDNIKAVMVRANRKGYQDREIKLATVPSDGSDVLELDIVMEPEEDSELAKVSGTVKGPDRKPVAGQRIQFSSTRLRQNYQSVTRRDGRFVIAGVEPGDDYMLSINAADAYQDYFRKDIAVPEKGLTLDIELETRATGVLRGQMVNVYGTAIPDFSLVLQTKARSYYNRRVIGDSDGSFEVEKAPAGELVLKTKSTPYFNIEGIQLAPDDDIAVTVVLDWGYDEIRGRVVDKDGYPVAVPGISLTWNHLQNGIRSSARRTAAADEQGNFRFTQLGPGTHRLTINAPGYRSVSLNHDVAMQGSDVQVKLVQN